MRSEQVRQVVFEEIGNIAPEADLASLGDNEDVREALDIDSIAFLNLMIAFDKRLGIAVPESDYPKLRSLRGMLAYLTARSGAAV